MQANKDKKQLYNLHCFMKKTIKNYWKGIFEKSDATLLSLIW